MSCDMRTVLIYAGSDHYRGYIVRADETSDTLCAYETVKKLSRSKPMFEGSLERCKSDEQSLREWGVTEYDTMIYNNSGFWEKLYA